MGRTEYNQKTLPKKKEKGRMFIPAKHIKIVAIFFLLNSYSLSSASILGDGATHIHQFFQNKESNFNPTKEAVQHLDKKLNSKKDPNQIFVAPPIEFPQYSIAHLQGFPVILPNTSGSDFGNAIMSPNAGDLDNDGDMEILAGREDGKLHGYDHTGNTLPNFPISFGNTLAPNGVNVTPALEDLDLNGDLEIIVPVDLGTKGELHVLNHNGREHPLWPSGGIDLGGTDCILSNSPAAADLNADGYPDIVLTEWHRTGNYVRAYDLAGHYLPGWPFDLGNGFHLESSPAIADVTGGWEKEVAFADGSSHVYVLDYKTDILAGWPVSLAAWRSSIAIGDLDGDGKKELVLGEDSGTLIHVYEPTGVERAGWPQTVAATLGRNPSLADLDGDGKLEIIIETKDPQKPFGAFMYVFHEDGTIMTGWPREFRGSHYDGQANVVIGDVDSDGELELVTVGHYDNPLLFVFKTTGELEPGFPYDFSEGEANNVFSSPVLADIDNDGQLEIVLTWFHNGIFGYPSQHYAAIDIIKIRNGKISVSQSPWGQFKHDKAQTGEHP